MRSCTYDIDFVVVVAEMIAIAIAMAMVVAVVTVVVVATVVAVVMVVVVAMVVVRSVVVSVLLTALRRKKTSRSSSSDLSDASGAVYTRADASALRRCALLHPVEIDTQISRRVSFCTNVAAPCRSVANSCIYHPFPFSYVP